MASYDLPSAFEEFSEARRNGFLKAMEVKEKGGHIVGTFCTFTPNELFDAARVHTVSLCGTSEETVSIAESDLPRNLCPLIKSSYGFALADKCPYTYFSDMIVGETTCDGKKKMYELLGRLKEVYVMQLPQATDREHAQGVWRSELRRLLDRIREKFGVEVTDEDLRKAARMRNRQRRAMAELMSLQKQCPPPAFFKDIFKVVDGSKFSFDQIASTEAIEKMTRDIRAGYEAGARPVPSSAKRILVTGCPIGGVMEKTVGVIEENGGVVVCMENCSGIKAVVQMVDEEAEDILSAIADRYLTIPCAVMSPNTGRMEMLRRLVKEFSVDGVVDVTLHSCHPYSVEGFSVKELCRELELPYMALETDYSTADKGQVTTRLSAFIEMV